jgi:hypothetical protein
LPPLPPWPPDPPAPHSPSAAYFTNTNNAVVVTDDTPIPLTTNLIFGHGIHYLSTTSITLDPGLYEFIWTVKATAGTAQSFEVTLFKNFGLTGADDIGRSIGFIAASGETATITGSSIAQITPDANIIQLINTSGAAFTMLATTGDFPISAQLTIFKFRLG